MRLVIFVCCVLISLIAGLSAFLFAMSSQPVQSIMMLLVTFSMMYTAKKLRDW